MLLALAAMLAQSVLLLPVPVLQGRVLDRLIAPRPDDNTSTLTWLVLGAFAASAGCHLGRALLSWRAGVTMTRVSLEVVRELTNALHRKLQRLPMAFFDREQTGRLMARLTGDAGTLLIFLNGGSLQLVTDLVLAAGISVALVWLRWELALAAFVAVPLYAVNHRLFAARLRELSKAVRAGVASVYGLLSERVSAVRVVRSFAQEDAEVAELDRRIDQHRDLSLSAARTGARQAALATLISGAGTVAVLGMGVALVFRGRLTVGELLAFYGLLAQLYNPIVRLTQFQSTAAATRVAVDRMAEILEEPETLADLPGALPVTRSRGELVFRDVTFAYGPSAPVLKNVSLRVEAGTTLGLLGASGSGKSTLLALAPRLYEIPPGKGAVLLDGRDVRGVRLADLRRAVALVPQQAVLFEGTLRANLTYAAPGASEAELWRALEAADLAGLVAALPEGLETPVGERGFCLSGGQRQRVALARALLTRPAVLLLDDCTSALDAETEARVCAALEEVLPGSSRIVVSHKVASVRGADRIAVLHDGRVIEEGTHDELLALGGRYARTCEQQAAVEIPPR
jgi:ABC-type multidrug transport system fused ATPase/permease subunit